MRPSVIATSWWQVVISGELFVHIGSSLFRQSLGFVIGATCGVMLGLLAGVLKPVERFYDPLISLIYPVPKVAILPLIFAWFGLGSLSKIVVMTISIFFPTYIAAFYGTRAVNTHPCLVGAQCRRQSGAGFLPRRHPERASGYLQRSAHRTRAVLRADGHDRTGRVVEPGSAT